MSIVQYAIIEMTGTVPHLVTIMHRQTEAEARADFREYVEEEAAGENFRASFRGNVGTIRTATLGGIVGKFYFDKCA